MTKTTITITTTTTIKHKPCMSIVFIFYCDDSPTYYYNAAINVYIKKIRLLLLRLWMLLEIIASTKVLTENVLVVVEFANKRETVG